MADAQAALAIYQTRPAPPVVAAWLQRILQPVITAAKLPSIPLEIRPTGKWGGWCSDRDGTPDGRVCLTSQICFWDEEKIIFFYVHEAAHRILQAQDVPAHGPEFLCLNACLLIRSAMLYAEDPLQKMRLYDLQDQPTELENDQNWRGQVLNWALQTAAELSPTDTPAEELAGIACARWQQHLNQAEKSRQQAANTARRRGEELAILKGRVETMVWLAGIGWGFFILCLFLFV